MTLMAVGKTPDVWAAGVEKYGIINWFAMLQHEDAQLQEYEKSLLGDPEKDRKIYEQDSPITYIHNVKAPLLVLQGRKRSAGSQRRSRTGGGFAQEGRQDRGCALLF
jgi:dipeptidyl aminopeptidase/acylaminoacyl peptidase